MEIPSLLNNIEDISSYQSSILTAHLNKIPTYVAKLQHYGIDSTQLGISAMKTLEKSKTPDGKPVYWTKGGASTLYEVTINLSPASKERYALMNFLIQQVRQGDKPSVVMTYHLICTTTNWLIKYLDGHLTEGPPGYQIESDKFADGEFKFSFNNVVVLPI